MNWSNSGTRAVEKAVGHGYPEEAMREVAERIATKDGYDSVHNWHVGGAARIVRRRKAYRALPILDGYCNIDTRYAPVVAPEGGFEVTHFDYRPTGKMVDHEYTATDGTVYKYQTPEREKIPLRTATGLPLRRDVVGRFLAHMESDRSNRYQSNGQEIMSYGWRLAYWQDGKIYMDEHMWEKPYSGETSSHMHNVRTHLWKRAANTKKYSEKRLKAIAGAVSHAAMNGYNMEDLRKSLDYSVTPPWKKVFVLARKNIRDNWKSRHPSSSTWLEDQYTPESVAAYKKWLSRSLSSVLALVNAYEERITNTDYSKKFPNVPNRFLAEPKLVKQSSIVKEENGILGWWFSNTLRLGYGDGRKVTVGATHHVKAEIVAMCQGGLHASREINQAFGYKNGRYLCRTLQWGAVEVGHDKVAAEYRRYLAIYDLKHYKPIDAPTAEWFAYGQTPFSNDLFAAAQRHEYEAFGQRILGMTELMIEKYEEE